MINSWRSGSVHAQELIADNVLHVLHSAPTKIEEGNEEIDEGSLPPQRHRGPTGQPLV